MTRHLQLENFDAPWLLEGATKPREATCPTSPGSSGLKSYGNVPNASQKMVIPAHRRRLAARKLTPPRHWTPENKTTERDGYAKRDSGLLLLMQLPDRYTKLAPMAKTDALGRPGAPQHLVNEFVDNGAKLNILRPAQGSLRSVASGINNCIRICTLTDPATFPPSMGTIRRRITTPNTGKTFGLYINRARKAALLLGHDDARLLPDVRLIKKGLRGAQDKSFELPNFIMTSDVMRIILDQAWQSNMGTIAYFPYLFSLRARLRHIYLQYQTRSENS